MNPSSIGMGCFLAGAVALFCFCMAGIAIPLAYDEWKSFFWGCFLADAAIGVVAIALVGAGH